MGTQDAIRRSRAQFRRAAHAYANGTRTEGDFFWDCIGMEVASLDASRRAGSAGQRAALQRASDHYARLSQELPG